MSALHDIRPCLRVCTTILISNRDYNSQLMCPNAARGAFRNMPLVPSNIYDKHIRQSKSVKRALTDDFPCTQLIFLECSPSNTMPHY